MDKQQTAVEWFMDKIGEKQPNGFYVIDTLEDVQNVFEQAKEKEKQQTIDFGNDLLAQNDSSYVGIPNLAEQYYNETYKNK